MKIRTLPGGTGYRNIFSTKVVNDYRNEFADMFLKFTITQMPVPDIAATSVNIMAQKTYGLFRSKTYSDVSNVILKDYNPHLPNAIKIFADLVGDVLTVYAYQNMANGSLVVTFDFMELSGGITPHDYDLITYLIADFTSAILPTEMPYETFLTTGITLNTGVTYSGSGPLENKAYAINGSPMVAFTAGLLIPAANITTVANILVGTLSVLPKVAFNQYVLAKQNSLYTNLMLIYGVDGTIKMDGHAIGQDVTLRIEVMYARA